MKRIAYRFFLIVLLSVLVAEVFPVSAQEGSWFDEGNYDGEWLDKNFDIERTGFADDVSIPTWAKPYVSSALKAGLVQGSRSSDGQVVFQAEEPITAAEAAVLLDRALQVTDVSADTLAEEGIPTWAARSAANLATCGVLSLDGGLSAPLTRGEAAELLCGALELQDSRDGGWF